jgi:hypothetical protein
MPGYFPVTRIELPLSDMGFNYKIAFGSSAQLVLHWLNLLYPALIAVLFAVIIYYLFSAKREKWKSYYLLIAAVIILPQFSFAYRLLLLLIPMYLFIKCPERKSLDLIYAVSFALLLIPKEFLIVVADVSLATIIDPLLILFTGCLIVCEGRLKGQGG